MQKERINNEETKTDTHRINCFLLFVGLGVSMMMPSFWFLETLAVISRPSVQGLMVPNDMGQKEQM